MIRKMELGDILLVAGIEKQCFSDAWSSELLEEGLKNPLDTYFILEADGRIGGFSCFRVVAGEGEIQRIAVSEELRGQGFGKKLMEAMVSFARQNRVPEVTLEVRAGNIPAINLYKAYGFREEAVRKSYYKNPTEDALIMWNRKL